MLAFVLGTTDSLEERQGTRRWAMEEPAADARGVQEPDHQPGARPIREQRAAKLGVYSNKQHIYNQGINECLCIQNLVIYSYG